MKKTLVSLFLIGSFSMVSAQPKLSELYAESVKCHQRQVFDCFLHYAKQLDSIKPSHPAYVYNLACAYALNGIPDKAFAALEKSILMDYSVEFENDADFQSLKDFTEFNRMRKLKSDLHYEISTSTKVVTLNEKDLHPEGVAYLAKEKLWLASSIRKGKIVSFDIKNGKCKDWLNAEGMFSVLAMKPDADESYLWVTTAAMEQWQKFENGLKGKSAVLKVDIKSRRIVETFTISGNHVFGDLAVSKNGTVYISDSVGNSVYKIEHGKILNWFALEGTTYNFQGMTLSGDESKMYLADYFRGILMIDMKNPQRRKWLDFLPGTVTKGIDGLVWYANSLIAIHNGVTPIRVIRYFLDSTGEGISRYQIIDSNRREFAEPTLGFVNDRKFYFFANCPWPAYDKANNLDDAEYSNPMLYSFSPD